MIVVIKTSQHIRQSQVTSHTLIEAVDVNITSWKERWMKHISTCSTEHDKGLVHQSIMVFTPSGCRLAS